MKSKRLQHTIIPLTIVILSTWGSGLALAALSEPQAIYYGQVVVNNQVLSASNIEYSVVVKRDNGEVLDTFTMGDHPEGFENQYVLRIPMDSTGARPIGYARTNDTVHFYAATDSSEELLDSAVVGERGTITALKLGMVDVDNDDIDDNIDNCLLHTNPNQANADGDSAGDACDDYPNNPNEIKDSDGDGMGDNYETAYGLNPLNPADANIDSDGDGKTNLEEFLAGTNPTDVVINQEKSEDIPLPLWALVLLGLVITRMGVRTNKAA